MKCKNCGTEVDNSFKFCPNCATAIEDTSFVDDATDIPEINSVTAEKTPIIDTTEKHQGVFIGKAGKKKTIAIKIVISIVIVIVCLLPVRFIFLPNSSIYLCVALIVIAIYLAVTINNYLFGKKNIGKARKVISCILLLVLIASNCQLMASYIGYAKDTKFNRLCDEVKNDLMSLNFDSAEDKIDDLPRYMKDEKQELENLLEAYETVYNFEALKNGDAEQYILDISNAIIGLEDIESIPGFSISSNYIECAKNLSSSPNYTQDFFNYQLPAKSYYDYIVGETCSVDQWRESINRADDAEKSLDNDFILDKWILQDIAKEHNNAIEKISKYIYSDSQFSLDYLVNDIEYVGYKKQLEIKIEDVIAEGFEHGYFSRSYPDNDYVPSLADLYFGPSKVPVCSEDDMWENAEYADLSCRMACAYCIAIEVLPIY